MGEEAWKLELKRLVADIELIELGANRDSFLAERPIFFAACVAKKLLDAGAVTDALRRRSFEVETFPPKRDEDFSTARTVEDCFDLNCPRTRWVDTGQLAREIIHSDGFVWTDNTPPSPSFLVFSYRKFDRLILRISVRQYVHMIWEVIDDRPRYRWTEYDVESGIVTTHASTDDPGIKNG